MSKADRLYERLSAYDLIIFDMDGTLYFQRGMQLRMAMRLIRHAFFKRHGIRDLLLVLKYRRLREKWDSARPVGDEELYRILSEKSGVDAGVVGDIITEWMFHDPMDVVHECRDQEILGIIERLMADGKQVCIYSDYPTEDKCRAVGLTGDMPQYYCGMEGIKTMKPNPSGLFLIMGRYPDIPREKVIMVGDRADRDGAAAGNAGIACLILRRFKILRYITEAR